jgi:hypothetical protein
MKKLALAQLLAKQTNVSTGVAADDLDCVVHDILLRIPAKPITIPG